MWRFQDLSKPVRCKSPELRGRQCFAQDMNDRKMNRRIACPTLALWSKDGPLDHWYADAGGPLGIWRDWASDLTGHPIEGGHFFPEHNSRETAIELRAFFGA